MEHRHGVFKYPYYSFYILVELRTYFRLKLLFVPKGYDYWAGGMWRWEIGHDVLNDVIVYEGEIAQAAVLVAVLVAGLRMMLSFLMFLPSPETWEGEGREV